jgi:glucosylceramidase
MTQSYHRISISCFAAVAMTQVLTAGTVQIWQTNRAGDRLTQLAPSNLVDASALQIKLQASKTYQEIVGFGASFTESSAWNLATIPTSKRLDVLDRLFNPERGAGFTLTRTHINSSDYSLRHYDYTQSESLSLEGFSIAEDQQGFTGDENEEVAGIELVDPDYDLLPMIREAMAVPGADFKLLASPWSPPAWMKEGEHAQMTGGWLRKDEDTNGRRIYYDAWARYLVKYLQAYADAGAPLWALTPQNEPGHAEHARWDSSYWDAEDSRVFIADYLGPAMVEAGLIDTDDLAAGVKLFIYDHNKADLFDFVIHLLSDTKTAQYVYGSAFHWYAINLEGVTDYRGDVLRKLAQQFPDKALLHTESSIDIHPDSPVDQYWDPMNRDWTGGRFTPFSQYAIDVITDLNNGSIGYIEWCMILSRTGGPNPYNNFNSAPVLIDPLEDTVLYTPLYYLLSHFSKYIRPGAHRIGYEADLPEGIFLTAAKNTDGSLAIVVFNENTEPQALELLVDGQTVRTSLSAQGLQTILYAQ